MLTLIVVIRGPSIEKAETLLLFFPSAKRNHAAQTIKTIDSKIVEDAVVQMLLRNMK